MDTLEPQGLVVGFGDELIDELAEAHPAAIEGAPKPAVSAARHRRGAAAGRGCSKLTHPFPPALHARWSRRRRFAERARPCRQCCG